VKSYYIKESYGRKLEKELFTWLLYDNKPLNTNHLYIEKFSELTKLINSIHFLNEGKITKPE